mmetsp:Transcript_97420/g.308977  ORF Transcript_97420/g.308977 Transcript_97420/m.308977 type:complete len:301 (-) Transcript_97420:68-970(-)
MICSNVMRSPDEQAEQKASMSSEARDVRLATWRKQKFERCEISAASSFRPRWRMTSWRRAVIISGVMLAAPLDSSSKARLCTASRQTVPPHSSVMLYVSRATRLYILETSPRKKRAKIRRKKVGMRERTTAEVACCTSTLRSKKRALPPPLKTRTRRPVSRLRTPTWPPLCSSSVVMGSEPTDRASVHETLSTQRGRATPSCFRRPPKASSPHAAVCTFEDRSLRLVKQSTYAVISPPFSHTHCSMRGRAADTDSGRPWDTANRLGRDSTMLSPGKNARWMPCSLSRTTVRAFPSVPDSP